MPPQLSRPALAPLQDEQEELVGQLQAARQKLAASETAAAGAASGQQRQELQAQLDEARQAVAAAQAAADDAQQRATAAAAELESIRSQLAAAQAQMAAQQAGEAAAEAEAAPTPLAKLRHQLDGLHESLAQLHAEHCAGRLHASTPALDRVSASAGVSARSWPAIIAWCRDWPAAGDALPPAD